MWYSTEVNKIVSPKKIVMCKQLQVTISSTNRIYVGEKTSDIAILFQPGESIQSKFDFKLSDYKIVEDHLAGKPKEYLENFCKMMAYRVIRGLGIDKKPRYQDFMKALREESNLLANSLQKLVKKMISVAKKPVAKIHKKLWKLRNQQRRLKRAGLTAVAVA